MISLGGNCAIAYHNNNNTTRYPFDWCKCSVYQLNNVLMNNFKDFENVTIVKFSKKHLSMDNKPTYIIKNKYNITFAHELYDNDINDFKNKLKRRIVRFKKLKDNTFIRLEIESKSLEYFITQYKILYNILKYKKLIVIIHKKYTIISKHIPEIKFIFFENYSSNWKYNNILWDNIL